jgi:hypothetical protein
MIDVTWQLSQMKSTYLKILLRLEERHALFASYDRWLIARDHCYLIYKPFQKLSSPKNEFP